MSNYSRRAKKRTSKRRGPSQRVVHLSNFPRTFNINPIWRRTLRYSSTTANPVDITGRCLLNSILSGISGSTAATNLIESIKVDRLQLYGVIDTSGDTFNSVAIIWKGERSPDKQIVATGNAIEPAYINSRPPPKSLAGFWVSNNTDDIDQVLFTIDPLQAGTIVDLTFSFTLGNGATRTCVIVNPALTGIGYASLDNATSAGTVGTNSLDIVGLQAFTITTP